MYLSDNELKLAIEAGELIVDPRPTKIDSNSIDLHLDKIEQARIWDIERYNREQLLWQTKEIVGTPEQNAKFIAFVDGKSTKARTGLIVHLTAPTIHATWSGNITLEIANLGRFIWSCKRMMRLPRSSSRRSPVRRRRR